MDSRTPIVIDDSEDEDSYKAKSKLLGRPSDINKSRNAPFSDRRGVTAIRNGMPPVTARTKVDVHAHSTTTPLERHMMPNSVRPIENPQQRVPNDSTASRTVSNPLQMTRAIGLERTTNPNMRYGMQINGRPQTPQTLQSSQPSQLPPRREICRSCQDLKVGCDGEQPCSTCAEPGIPCEYPGRKPPPPVVRPVKTVAAVNGAQNISQRNAVTSLANSQKSPMTPPISDSPSTTRNGEVFSSSKQSTQAAKPITVLLKNPNAPNSMMRVSGIAPRQLLSVEEAAVVNTYGAVAPNLESVRLLIQKLRMEMKQYRENYVKPILKQAKADSVLTTASTLTMKSNDPFANLKPKPQVTSSDNKTSAKIHDLATIQFKMHAKGVPGKWKVMSTQVDRFPARSVNLPKYRSICRLGPSTLAPNVHTSKYWVYDATDEIEDAGTTDKYKELEQRYNHDYTSMNLQRKCFEVVELWRPWVEHATKILKLEFSDVLYFFLHASTPESIAALHIPEQSQASWISEKQEACKTCELDTGGVKWKNILYLLRVPDARALSIAGLFAFVFHDTSGVSLWHLASTSRVIKELLGRAYPGSNDMEGGDHLCLVCFLHDCPTHGEFQESEDDNSGQASEAYINDDEKEHNGRQHVSLAYLQEVEDREHICGIYCVDRSQLITELYGRRPDGTIAGSINRDVVQTSNKFHDNHRCSEECFWLISNRRKSKISELSTSNVTAIPTEWHEVLKAMTPSYLTNKRGSCMLAALIPGVSCLTVFYHMLIALGRRPHPLSNIIDATINGTTITQGRKVSKIQLGLDTTKSAELDERPPFVPCSHDGPCQNNSACTCAEDKIFCEWFCGCDLACKRRFRGCTCAGVSRTCFNDARCECWANNRECDPWLCKGCGVLEVLDSSNKYNESVRKGRCQNNRIQLNLPARTIKAPSEVQGYGLYAGEDLDEFAYIGEYRGEIVSNQESDRRGAVYANLGQEYLFVINRDQEMDASKMGNKMRFMNNSQLDANINVLAKKMLCNGVQRVMLYAKRRIPAGEELLYNYNYPISVVKKFWERGEKPPDAQGGTVVPADNLSSSQSRAMGRFAKISNNVYDGNPQTRQTSKLAKRKRDTDDVHMTNNVGVVSSDDQEEYQDDGEEEREDENNDLVRGDRTNDNTAVRIVVPTSKPRVITEDESDFEDDMPLMKARRNRVTNLERRQAVRKVTLPGPESRVHGSTR